MDTLNEMAKNNDPLCNAIADQIIDECLVKYFEDDEDCIRFENKGHYMYTMRLYDRNIIIRNIGNDTDFLTIFIEGCGETHFRKNRFAENKKLALVELVGSIADKCFSASRIQPITALGGSSTWWGGFYPPGVRSNIKGFVNTQFTDNSLYPADNNTDPANIAPMNTQLNSFNKEKESLEKYESERIRNIIWEPYRR